MTRKLLTFSLLLSAFMLGFANPTFASDSEEDKTSFIMHHVVDSHEWHFATIGQTHVTLPLPVIVYSADRGLEFFKSSDFQNHDTHKFGKEYAHEGYFIDDHDRLGRVDGASFIELSITKNVVMMFIVMFLVAYLALSAANYYKKNGAVAPKGAAAILEPIVIFVRDEIAQKSIGPKYKKIRSLLDHTFPFCMVW